MKHECTIDDLLEKVGLRCTKDRHDLLGLFLSSRAWSASQMAQAHPEKDLSTIYRNVQKLMEAGLIQSIHTHTSEEYFEKTTSTHHDHRTCPQCHLMSCIPCPITKFTEKHVLEIQEPCEMCV